MKRPLPSLSSSRGEGRSVSPARRELVQSEARRRSAAVLINGSLLALLLFLVGPAAFAQAKPPQPPDPSNGYRAWPMLVRVPVATPANQAGRPIPLSIAARVGYGYIESSGEPDTAVSRMPSGLAISYTPFRDWLFAVDLDTRADWSEAPDETRPNFYSEPRVAVRYLVPGLERVDVGVEANVRFLGNGSFVIEWPATTPSLKALFGLPISSSTYLAASLGFQLDNSRKLPGSTTASPTSRVTLGTSCCSEALLGIGVSHRFPGLATEWLADLSAEILIGNGAPAVFESPWILGLGARHPFSDSLSAQGSIEVGLSQRPEPTTPPTLVPTTPRIGMTVGLIWTPGKKPSAPAKQKPAPAPPPAPKPAVPVEPPPVARSAVTGVIVDEAGSGVPDVELTLVLPDGTTAKQRSFADGRFSFPDVPEDLATRIDMKSPGYDPAKLRFEPGPDRHGEVVLYPSLPAGQVKGSIRDLQGKPVQATLTLEADGTTVEVAEDGTYELELRPGRHTLIFAFEGLQTQRRVIEVEERGVVILNVALSR